MKMLVKRFEDLHRRFEKLFTKLISAEALDEIKVILSDLHSISKEKASVVAQLLAEASKVGGEFETAVRELQKAEHQMKFRIEEALEIVSSIKGFSDRERLKGVLRRMWQFHRVYDYSVSQALAKVVGEVELLELLGDGEKEKKLPPGILERLNRIEDIERKINILASLAHWLYSNPSLVHKVEDSLKRWHERGLGWVEARNVSADTGIDRETVREILEGLTLIGVVERKERGGEGVYKLRSSGED
ncbi:hypothetical protein [Pyrococcus yayanosii]